MHGDFRKKHEEKSLLKRRISRRKALSTAAKVGIGVVVAGVVAGVSGYYAGLSAAPARTVERTQTVTYTVTKTVTAAPVTTPPTTVTITTPTTRKAKINVICLDASFSYAIQELAPKFTERTGIEITFENTAFADIHTKELTDLVSHTGRYDVIMMDNPLTIEFAGGGYLEPIDEYLDKYGVKYSIDYKNTFYGWPRFIIEDAITQVLNYNGNYKGHLYGLPLSPGCFILMCNKEWFEHPDEQDKFEKKYGYKLRPPTTLKELRDIAEFFTRKKGEKIGDEILKQDVYGFSMSGGKGNMSCQTFGYLLWSSGGDYYAFGQGLPDPEDPEHNMPIVHGETGINILEWWVKELKPFMPPGFTAYEWDEVTKDFTTKRAAMALQWNVFCSYVEDPTKSAVAGKTIYSVIPGNPDAPSPNIVGAEPGIGYSSLGGWVWVINRDSKNKDAAFEFILWASGITMTEEELRAYVEHEFAGLGARKTSYQLPGTKGVKTGAFPVMLETLERRIKRRPAIAEEAQWEYLVGSPIQEALAGMRSPKDALEEAAKNEYMLMVSAGWIPATVPMKWPSKYVNPDGATIPG